MDLISKGLNQLALQIAQILLPVVYKLHLFTGSWSMGVWGLIASTFSGMLQGRKIFFKTKLHGRPVLANIGYSYFSSSRIFPHFNEPYVELVNQTFLKANSPLCLVDVGTGIGDTVLLIEANCPAMIGKYICVEPDKLFYDLTCENTKGLPCVYFNQAVSSARSQIPSMHSLHPGTASCLGPDLIESMSLDELLKNEEKIDVLKIDVDGFDGEVIKGFTEGLKRYKPAVIFEWHPLLYGQTNHSIHSPFETLEGIGYSSFIWFTKLGVFSHFSSFGDKSSINALALYCLTSTYQLDWHYDVVAIHQDNLLDTNLIADCAFARNRRSRF